MLTMLTMLTRGHLMVINISHQPSYRGLKSWAPREKARRKYLPGMDVEALERNVWQNGLATTNGRTWKVMAFRDIIGASAGAESRWVRVEKSGNTIHGHPITQQAYERLIE